MEWLIYIFGGTSVVSISLFLIFFKQNRALKQQEVEKGSNEVNGGRIETEMSKIALGDKYLESIIEATNKLNSYQSDYKSGIDSLSSRIDEIMEDVKSIKTEQATMCLYLNGKYEEFKEHINKLKHD